MDIGVPFASGREADVFGIDGGRVLRRYREGGDVAAEAAVMAYVGRLGFPVPEVHSADGADLVMERLDGPTMLAAIGAGGLGLAAGAEILADLHARLHALPARVGATPDARILHLDLHPDNVVMTSRGPVVIDWRNSVEGPSDLDVALSALILAQVAVGGSPALTAEALASAGGPAALVAAARALLTEFLARTDGDAVRLLDRAVAMRRANPTMTAAELAQLDGAAELVRTAELATPRGRRIRDLPG